MTKTALVRRE